MMMMMMMIMMMMIMMMMMTRQPTHIQIRVNQDMLVTNNATDSLKEDVRVESIKLKVANRDRGVCKEMVGVSGVESGKTDRVRSL